MSERGELILVLGGARSGKSTFAQRLAMSQDLPVAYVASALPLDEEMRRRIAKHQEARPAAWATVEAPYSGDREVVRLCKEKNFVLWDCVTVFLSNIFLECHGMASRGNDIEEVIPTPPVPVEMELLGKIPEETIEESIILRLEAMLCQLENCPGTLVAVSNEVGSGIVPEYPLGRDFRDLLGRVNQLLAQRADKVFFLVAGIPIEIKEHSFHPGASE